MEDAELPRNKEMTLDSFLISPGNKLAHSAAQRIIAESGTAFNPLFMYGGVGLGKTHLMHGIVNGSESQFPDRKIVMLACDTLIRQYVRWISEGGSDDFFNRWRNVDALLIDDVQFLADSEQTQAGFFHLFEHLINRKIQIVLSSDRLPQELETLEPRLKSRFAAGLVCDLQAPTLETRVGILQNRAASLQISVPPDVIQIIAERFSQNVRELLGAMTRVIAVAEIQGEPISSGQAQVALQQIQTENPQSSQMIVGSGKSASLPASLQEGQNYLFFTTDNRPVAHLMNRSLGSEVLVLSSTFPEKMKQNTGIEAKEMYWLTSSEGPNALKPSRLSFEITQIILAFVKNHDRGAVWLDGLEILLLTNGFSSITEFIKLIGDTCSMRGLTFVVTVAREQFDPRQLTTLMREFDQKFDI